MNQQTGEPHQTIGYWEMVALPHGPFLHKETHQKPTQEEEEEEEEEEDDDDE